MSRIGQTPISIPDAVKVDFNKQEIHVEGPKGKTRLDTPHTALM